MKMVLNKLKKQLMDVLDKEHQFDLPQGIVDQEFSDIGIGLSMQKKIIS